MLVVHDLTVRLGDWVGCYDLSVPRGTLLALVGPSGGGKSTLLSAIAGFERPERGKIRLRRAQPAGPQARGAPRRDRLPGAQSPAQPDGRRQCRARLVAVPEAVPGRSCRDRRGACACWPWGSRAGDPATLSGGQRQRVALARALLSTRPVLLLDEPLSGLDPALRREMVALIDALRREKGLTVVMTTHTPDDVAGIADQMLKVEDGRVVPIEAG